MSSVETKFRLAVEELRRAPLLRLLLQKQTPDELEEPSVNVKKQVSSSIGDGPNCPGCLRNMGVAERAVCVRQ